MGACHARMVGCSRVPGPHGLAAKEEDRASDNSGTVQTTGASHTSHNMHSFHGSSSRRLYLSERALSERIKFEVEKEK